MTSIRRTVAGWVSSIADRSQAPAPQHRAEGPEKPSIAKRVTAAGLAASSVMSLVHMVGVDAGGERAPSLGGGTPPPGARLVPGDLGFQVEERPTWTVGRFTLVGATESEVQSFNPVQRRVYDWMTRFAQSGNEALATQLARMAQAPAAEGTEPSSSITLDVAAMDRVISGFHVRGVSLSDKGLARQFELLREKMPKSQAKLVETLFERGQRLYALPSELSREQKQALELIGDKSNRWVREQREALGLEAPKGALGRQEAERNAVVIGPTLLNRIYQEHLAPRSDHRITEVALDWVRNPRVNPNNGRVDWDDYCQAFVWRVFAEAGHPKVAPGGPPNAKGAYYIVRDAGLARTDWQNLRGNAALWWDVRTNGHTAIALDKMGPDGKPLVAMTGSVLWYSTPMAKVITWTEMVEAAGHPTAYSVAWDPKRDQP